MTDIRHDRAAAAQE